MKRHLSLALSIVVAVICIQLADVSRAAPPHPIIGPRHPVVIVTPRRTAEGPVISGRR